MTVRQARPSDNAALLELTRRTPMPGVVGLRIDRAPDFFRLLRLRGEGATFVAEEDGRLVGCISLTARPAFVGGAVQSVGYVGDLKVLPERRGRGIAGAVALEAFRYATARGIDLVFCVASAGNRRVLDFLDGRSEVPPFVSVGRFDVYQCLPRRPARPCGPYRFDDAREDDLEAVAALSRRFNAGYALAPALSTGDWRALLSESGPGRRQRVLVARRDGQVRAALATLDTHFAKQHVLTRLPAGLRLAAGASKRLARALPVPALPGVGEEVLLLYLRHPAAEPGYEPGLAGLVRHARGLAGQDRWALVAIGLHERDPLRRLFRRVPRFTVGSQGFVTSLSGDRASVERVTAGIPLEDYAVA